MAHASTHIFVNGLSTDPGLPGRKGQLKQFHRKSRTGCQRCRTRRVKCNEAKPICGNCERNGMTCIYDRLANDVRNAESQSVESLGQTSKASTPSSSTGIQNSSDESGDSLREPAETRQRRMLELELMHFYITETGPSIAFNNESSYDLFVKAIPRMSFRSDALLYSVYAFAALHRAKQGPPEAKAVSFQQHELYLQLAFQNHRKELARFSSDNVDVLLMTAHLMRLVASVVLSERSLVPYTPPLEWLRIASSHSRIFSAAWDLVGDDPSTQVARLILSTPVVWDQNEREGADKRQGLEHILLVPDQEDDPNLWDDDIKEAYESTLSYIGGIMQAIQRQEPSGPIGRRLILFPLLVDKVFIELVGESRPRALVIMAYYFTLVTTLKSYWYIGDTGAREVRAIAMHLPIQWQTLMVWPLQAIENGIPS